MKNTRKGGLLAVAALALVIAACGGDDDTPAVVSTEAPPATSAAATDPGTTEAPAADTTPIKIGILSNCEGPFGPFYGDTLAGVHEALVEVGGATPLPGKEPNSEGAVINGHPITTVNGCSDATPEKALSEAKRLIEQENVDVLVGPLSGSEGIAVANYAKEHPDKTFLNGVSGAQDTTLKVQAPNFFRFHSEGAQWTAGLGAYAYNVLGWRNVVTLADDYDFPYTQVAGFVAEFCALGGNISKRLWPALGEEDYASFIADIPGDADGFFLGVGGTGTVAFVKQYTQLEGNLADRIMGGVFMTDPLIQKELGDRIVGVVTAGMTSADSTLPSWTAFTDNMTKNFPDNAPSAPGPFVYGYYSDALALMKGLEAVGGDLSDSQAGLQAALSGLTIEAPFGAVSLDANRNAIADNFLQQLVQNDDGSIGVKTLATIPQVDQTYAGAFSADTPTPDRDNPECKAGTPPPWTAGITKEALGL